MFTVCNIEKNADLDDVVRDLLCERDFAELRDNFLSIGIYLYHNNRPTDLPGRIQIATEVEKMHGLDIVVYINSHWYTYSKRVEIEAFVYQMLLSVQPMIVGKENTPVIKMDKETGIQVSPETVRRYGKTINWYKELYREKAGRNDEQ